MKQLLRDPFQVFRLVFQGFVHGNKILYKKMVIPLGSLPGRYRQSVESFTNYKNLFFKLMEIYMFNTNSTKKYSKRASYRWYFLEWGLLGCTKACKGIAIENWLPIFEKGALCVNLQYGDTSQEEQFIKEKGFEFVTFPKVDYKKI